MLSAYILTAPRMRRGTFPMYAPSCLTADERDPDGNDLAQSALEGLTDDELAEQIERAHWHMEINSQVALMNYHLSG